MFFTREDILKIQSELAKLGVKDSQLNDAHTPLDSNDILALSQGGRNVKIRIQDFLEQLHLLSSDDFINVTTKFDAPHLTLEEAIQILPSKVRKTGLTITFQNIEGNWEIWQFTGSSVNQFNMLSVWENCKIPVNSIAVPDEEDLTMETVGTKTVTKFKDKQYDPENFSGMGRVYLRKNVTKVQDPVTKQTKTVNLLTQKMLGKENTIYVIQYDYDLNGQEIVVPSESTLLFEGGSIYGGSIVLNNGVNIVGKYSTLKLSKLKCNGNNRLHSIIFDGEWNSYGIQIYGDNVLVSNCEILNIKAPTQIWTASISVGDWYTKQDKVSYNHIVISDCRFSGCEPNDLSIVPADTSNQVVARMIMLWGAKDVLIKGNTFDNMYGSVDSDIIMVDQSEVITNSIPFVADTDSEGNLSPYKGIKYGYSSVTISNNVFLQHGCKSSIKILSSGVSIYGNTFLLSKEQYRGSNEVISPYAVIRVYYSEDVSISNNFISSLDDTPIDQIVQISSSKADFLNNTVSVEKASPTCVVSMNYSICSVSCNSFCIPNCSLLGYEWCFLSEFSSNDVIIDLHNSTPKSLFYIAPNHYTYQSSSNSHLARINNNVIKYTNYSSNQDIINSHLSFAGDVEIIGNIIQSKAPSYFVLSPGINYGDSHIKVLDNIGEIELFIDNSNHGKVDYVEICGNTTLGKVDIYGAKQITVADNTIMTSKVAQNYTIRFLGCEEATLQNNSISSTKVLIRVERESMKLNLVSNYLSQFSTYFPNNAIKFSGGDYVPSGKPVYRLDYGSRDDFNTLTTNFNTSTGHIFLIDNVPYIKCGSSYKGFDGQELK